MATVYRAPDPIQSTQFVPGGNTPASAAQMFFYIAGSSTKTTVYRDNAGSVAWANPIVLDSGGNLPSNGSVWIPTGVTVDVVLAPATDVDPPQSPYWTKEDIAGINDVVAAASDWVTGPTPTFVSGTQFVLQGDQTSTFKNGRRIRTTNTGGTIYGRITSVASASGSTTVNTVSDTGSLDSGLLAVSYGLLDPQLSSITDYHVNRDGGSIASIGGGTTNIWGSAGNAVHITGTNSVSNFSTASYAGVRRTVIVDNALTFVHSASLDLPGNANISASAGDRFEVLASTAANAVVTQYTSGFPAFSKLASLTAANTTSIDFISGITSVYNEYLVKFVDVTPVSNNPMLFARVSENAGSAFIASSNAYRWANSVLRDDGNNATTFSSGDTEFQISADSGVGNYAMASLCGELRFFSPAGAVKNKKFLWDLEFQNNSTSNVRVTGGGGFVLDTNAIDAIRFLFASGNISTGTFELYGIR